MSDIILLLSLIVFSLEYGIRISMKNWQHNGQEKKYKRTNNYLQNIHIKLHLVYLQNRKKVVLCPLLQLDPSIPPSHSSGLQHSTKLCAIFRKLLLWLYTLLCFLLSQKPNYFLLMSMSLFNSHKTNTFHPW
jgi:hypothetical protein